MGYFVICLSPVASGGWRQTMKGANLHPAAKRKRNSSSPKPPVNSGSPDSHLPPILPLPARTFCDVCWGKPNKQGMIFQQCRLCKVGVHNECYGIRGNAAADPNFVCHACRAIGTTVTVRSRHPDGTRMRLTTTERPTECCLCSVDDTSDWYHAMHPIYDHYGLSGRHMVLPPDADHSTMRLAWAHTLCCLVISAHRATGGCVYGCNVLGRFDGEGDDDDNSDASSVNSALGRHEPSPSHRDDTSIHHFVYCLRLKGQADNAWTKAIKDQQQLKCYICGSNDRRSTNFAIALQCSANDPDEFPDFTHTHVLLDRHGEGDTCYVAMHVGCAMWGRNDVGEYPTERRVYFFPGRHKRHVNASTAKRGVTQSVTNLYCPVHAQDLVRAKIAGATTVRYPTPTAVPPTRPRCGHRPAPRWPRSHQGGQSREAKDRNQDPSQSLSKRGR